MSPPALPDPSALDAADRHDRRLVGWLSLAQLISWGSVFYGFGVLLAPVEAALGLSRAESSLAFSLSLLVEGLVAYPVGRWIDRGHERAVMTGGSLLLGLGLWLHSLVGSAAGLYAVWALLGAGMAATLYNPVFAVVTRRFPMDFRRAIITMTFLGGLASTVFIPLTAGLINGLGWRHALWVLAALQWGLCAPLHAMLLRSAPRPQAPASRHAPDAHSPAFAQLLRSAPFLLIAAFTVLMMGVSTALPPHMVSLLREAGLPEAWVIVVPASIGVVQVAGRMLLLFFEHRFDVHVANRVIPCLLPLGMAFLLGAALHWTLGALFVLLWGLGNGMVTIVKGTAIAQYVDRTHVASLNGAIALPAAVARALAPLALGLLWTPHSGYRAGLLLMIALGLLAVAALWTAQRRALRPATPR